MPSANALRLEIENKLRARIPSALTPRPRTIREVAQTGSAALDNILEGGLPVGAITEMVGSISSGRTTLAFSVLAEMTQAAKSVAWIDASDTLDPESAAAAGIDLARQLWVRCGGEPHDLHPAVTTSADPHHGAALLAEGSRTPAPSGGCGSPHPRGEARGLSQAVDAFLQPDVFSRPAPPRDPAVSRRNRMIGTPGAPNRKLLDREPQDARPFPRRARDREEQIATDRLPNRRQMMNAAAGKASRRATLQSEQLANTAAAAAARPQAGHWKDNANNAHGRSLHTPPNAIAAGLPRFQEMEARAAGQGHGSQAASRSWKPVMAPFGPPPERRAATPPQTEAPVPPHIREQRAPLSFTPREEARKELLPTVDATLKAALPSQKASLAGDPPRAGKGRSPIWRALDQALRATDLLLTAGGFSAVVLDLGSIPPEFSWRIPLATWFRFRAAADHARAVLIILTSHPCARSSAELVLRFGELQPQQSATVLTGATLHVFVDRRRFESQGSVPEACAHVAESGRTLHLVAAAKKQPGRAREAVWPRAAAWTGSGLPQSGIPVPGTVKGASA